MPFSLPLKADKVPRGFQVSLLVRVGKSFVSAGDITAVVEEQNDKSNVLLIRFYEGPAAQRDRVGAPPADPTKRLQAVLDSLVDVPVIMQAMPPAIRKAVLMSRTSA